jgi:hypothetical protein
MLATFSKTSEKCQHVYDLSANSDLNEHDFCAWLIHEESDQFFWAFCQLGSGCYRIGVA